MADYNSLAIYDIKDYLWESLKSYNILSESDYYADGFDSPLVPIIPIQQVPEFNNLLPSKAYIVYDVETLPIDQDWWIINDIVNFIVISPRNDEINKIINFMIDLFRRYDDSAKDVRQSTILSNNFIFHYTSVDNVRYTRPSNEEGGLKGGDVDIIYCYSRITDSEGRF